MVKVHPFQVGRAAIKYSFPTLQKKDGDLFAVANRNYPTHSPFGVPCLFDVITDSECHAAHHLNCVIIMPDQNSRRNLFHRKVFASCNLPSMTPCAISLVLSPSGSDRCRSAANEKLHLEVQTRYPRECTKKYPA
jgi:hypothetical protein